MALCTVVNGPEIASNTGMGFCISMMEDCSRGTGETVMWLELDGIYMSPGRFMRESGKMTCYTEREA
jgi:hypothetical protein